MTKGYHLRTEPVAKPDAERFAALVAPLLDRSPDSLRTALSTGAPLTRRLPRVEAEALQRTLGGMGLQVKVEEPEPLPRPGEQRPALSADIGRIADVDPFQSVPLPAHSAAPPPNPPVRGPGQLSARATPQTAPVVDAPLWTEDSVAPRLPSGRGRSFLLPGLLLATAAVVLFIGAYLVVSKQDDSTAVTHLLDAREAYRARRYFDAQSALAKARSAGAELELLRELELAVAVGPQVDVAEALLDSGKLEAAQARAEVALARAPDDPRARQLAAAIKRRLKR